MSEKTRRIVCAAVLYPNGNILCGPRHFDSTMHKQIAVCPEAYKGNPIQGFIDQNGIFLTRGEALEIAKSQGQILYSCGGDDLRLFSENLY